MEKVPTGIPGLDTITCGGLPRGRSTLVTGRSGTAKTVLALHLACNLAKAGARPILLSTEETPGDLVANAESLGFRLESLVRDGAFVIHDLTRAEEPATYSGTFDVAGLVHIVEALVKKHRADALVLDSATALFSPRPPAELVRSLFHQLLTAFRRLGLTVIVTAEAAEDYGGPLTTLGVEDYVCDMVIVLRNLVDNERRRRSLEVHKYRRSRHHKGEFPFTISHDGIVVFPLEPSVREEPAVMERFPSGIPGLDEATRGGFLRDSIVLLRGPTGSGKTTLAGLYARAGALRGERVAYYGFEETRRVLFRNFASLGMSFEELEKAGKLHVSCAFPEAISPEDLLVQVRQSLASHRPSLVVFDSISAIEHSAAPHSFRRFAVALASLLREHSRSALLTQTVSHTAESGPAFLSTIPDAILLLDYDLEDAGLARSLRVLKMRGSAHATNRRKLAIEAGGLAVET